MVRVRMLIFYLGGAAALLTMTGCTYFVNSKQQMFVSNLTASVTSSRDVETVKAGLPAYLLLINGMLEGDSENVSLLLAASGLYSAYSAVFSAENEQRTAVLTGIALQRALEAACVTKKSLCQLETLPFKQFETEIQALKVADLPLLYALGSSWAAWVQVRSDDWAAIAKIPNVAIIMQQVVRLDAEYLYGQAYIYLGVLDCMLPDAMGGHSQRCEQHFKKAIAMSQGENLMAKVYYAKYFARQTYHEALFNQLLSDVVEAHPMHSQFNLSNVVAKKQAHRLIEQSRDYF